MGCQEAENGTPGKRGFIVDEQDHFNWVRQHLSLMNEIGMENYLIEQLGE